MHGLAVKEAFTWKRGASFACFNLIRFSSMHYFDELKNLCNTTLLFGTENIDVLSWMSATNAFQE